MGGNKFVRKYKQGEINILYRIKRKVCGGLGCSCIHRFKMYITIIIGNTCTQIMYLVSTDTYEAHNST